MSAYLRPQERDPAGVRRARPASRPDSGNGSKLSTFLLLIVYYNICVDIIILLKKFRVPTNKILNYKKITKTVVLGNLIQI